MLTTSYTLGTGATNNTVLTMAFGTPTNVLTENDTTSSSGAVTTKNAEAYIAVSSFGFDSLIPSGSVILQVNLRARGTASSGASAHTATPYISSTAGSAVDCNNTSLTTVTSNAITRPGGGTWTRADLLDSTFTVRLRSLHPNNTTSRTYQWAWVEVQVLYTSVKGVAGLGSASVKTTAGLAIASVKSSAGLN